MKSFTVQLDFPLPELDARPGDWIYVDPENEEYPVSVVRHHGPESLALIRDRLPLLQRLVAAGGASSHVPAPQPAHERGRPDLRLV